MKRLITLALILLPAAAFAAGSEHGGGEAHGIPWKEMAFHAINLAILVIGVGWAAKGPVQDALKNRSLAVKKDLEESHALRKEAQDRFDDLEARLARFEQQLEEMKRDALSEAEADARRIAEKTQEEIAAIRQAAEKTIRDEVVSARTSLQREAVELAVQIAEENVRSRISTEDQDRLARDLLGAVKQEVSSHG